MTPPAAILTPTDQPVTRSAVSPELAGSTAERLLLIVAPSNGRFRPELTSGHVERGQLVARVAAGRGRDHPVLSPVRGVISGLLALPGHLVVRGQALAWALVDADPSA